MNPLTWTAAQQVTVAVSFITVVLGTIVGGFLLQWFKQRHERQMEAVKHKLNIQQSNHKDRAEAAKIVMKRWTLLYEQQELTQRFYEGLLNPYQLTDHIAAHWENYETQMEMLDKKLEEQGDEATHLYFLYFAPDPSGIEHPAEGEGIPGVTGSTAMQILKLQEAMEAKFHEHVHDVANLSTAIDKEQDPKERKKLQRQYNKEEARLVDLIQQLHRITTHTVAVTKQALANLQEEIRNPQ